jgi:hypothetical protein
MTYFLKYLKVKLTYKWLRRRWTSPDHTESLSMRCNDGSCYLHLPTPEIILSKLATRTNPLMSRGTIPQPP